MKARNYSILIKQFHGHFVALCPELNIAAQGESLIESREEIAKAIKTYLAFSKKTGVKSAGLDIDTLRAFLLEDIELPIRFNKDIAFSESFASSVVSA